MSLTILLFLILPPDLYAREQQESGIGHRLGVSVPAGDTDLLNAETLALLQDSGISLIEIEGMAPDPLIARLNESEIFLFVKQVRRFSIPLQFSDPGTFLSEDRQLIKHYESQLPGQVVGYGLFRYPAENRPDMREQMSRHAAQLNRDRESPLTLYFESAFSAVSGIPDGYSFRSVRFTTPPPELISPVTHVYPAGDDRTTVENLRDVLTLSLEQSESVVLMELRPLLNLMERHRPFRTALQEYAFRGEIFFALPVSEPATSTPNFAVILLILIIAGYLFHYKYNLFYRESLIRYFKTHHFFIDDIMEYRLRTPLSGVVQLLLFILVGGLFTWLIAQSLFSPLGIEALVSHYPALARPGSDLSGFFVGGMLFTTVLLLFSLCIIHVPAFKTRTPGQTVNVYGWLLHLNLPVLILMITLHESDSQAGWIQMTATLFLAIWLLNAIIACVDVARYLNRNRILYLIITIGTHLSVVALGIVAVTGNPKLLQALRLALNLP